MSPRTRSPAKIIEVAGTSPATAEFHLFMYRITRFGPTSAP
jgi:hypothetical protein